MTAGIRDWLIARVAERTGLPADQVDPDRPLYESGLSSRESTALAADLGRYLGRPLAPTLVWQCPTINALAAHLSTVEHEDVAAVEGREGEPIAIVGVGCRLPGGAESADRYWRLLDAGSDGIRDVPEDRWEAFGADLGWLPGRGGFLGDVAGFDAGFFGITPDEAETMDPQQRMLLEVAWAALEDAGIPPSTLRGSRTGVFVGLSAGEYGHLTMSDPAAVDVWSATGAATSIAANRLSYLFDLRGPSLTLDTACSSSLVAVHQAVQSLRHGECGTALAAGVNLLLSPAVTATFHRAGVLAADGHCKPFDAAADGIARGEGCGVVVLKPLKAARRAGDRVLAVIRGSAVNSDGRSNGLVAPNPDAQAALLRAAYAAAGVEPSSVDYVEAHGTGTALGDPIEAGALGAVLGAGREPARPLLIGSVKGNLGHLEGAAGIAGLIKVVLAMVHRRLPPTPHHHEPSPHIDFPGLGLRVVGTATDWPRYSGVARAGISAFGFGGTNAHVVLEEWPAASFPARGKETEGPQVFALSARSTEVLRARAADLADWLDDPAQRAVPPDAVAATLARGRDHLPVRGAVIAEKRDRIAASLREMAAGREGGGVVTGEAGRVPRVVFVFSGYGSQWPGMGRHLLRTEPAFRAEVEALDPAFVAGAGFSLREVLSGEHDLPDLGATQLALFGMQLALAGLWRAHGVVPAAVLGHSMGEVAAAVVAGALDVADGLRVMATRARLLAEVDATGDGAMAVVELSPAELADLEAEFPGITVAVYASPVQCTVSGAADQVEALVSHVERLGRLARRLPVGGAGHSEAVDSVLGRFRADLGGLTPKPAEITCYSSVLTDPRWTPAFDVEYWAANLRRPVRFSQALAAATADGHGVFIEISPHPVALAAIEQSTGALALPSASRKIDERTAFLTTLARLHTLGLPGVLDARGPRPVPVALPGPRWRHERFWPRRPAAVPGSGGAHPLLGVHIEQPTGGGHLWRGDVGTAVLPWLADHAAMGVALFPAAGFLELALAAAKAVLRPGRQLRVGDLELHRVLPLAAHTEVTTSLGTGSGPSEVDIYARAAHGGWIRHATARVRDGDTTVVPFGAVGGEARPIDLYQALAKVGQSYGPAFRALHGVLAVPGRASASITQPADHPAYVLHPVIADACLHALAAAGGDALREADGVFLPLTVGEVVLAGDPRRGVRVDALLDSLDPAGDGLVGGVQLVDADDVVLVEFREVYCRRFQRSALPVPMTDLLFETVWRQAELPATEAVERNWVVLHDAGHQGAPWLTALRDRLTETGDELAMVQLGDRAALAAVLRSREVTGVLACVATTGDPDPMRAGQTIATLSAVVAELAETASSPRLWLVSAGASAVEPGERGDPGQSCLRGLIRVLAFEHPGLRASQVDFDAEPDPALLWVGRLVAEIRADAPDDEVSWREGIRYTRVLGRPTLGEPVRETVVREGAYVITGGLGGLGLVAADWLAGRGATRLVLSGRHGAGPDTEPALTALRDLGVEVLVVTGDIAEPGTAEALVAAATEGGVPLRGVLHAAGVLADGAASAVGTEAVEAVWRAKALGSWRLHEATAGHDLDWWLAYSSAAALFGSPGQAAYATANAWVDALVAWRRAGGLPSATIGWGAWGEAGAAVGSRNPVLEPLGTEEALTALDAVLTRDRVATGIARVDAGTVLALFPRLVERPFFGMLVPRDEPGVAPSTWDGLDALRAVLPEAAREMLADYLAGLVAGMLGLAADEIDRHASLTRLGLDSLTAMRARGVVERDFGLPLPIPLLLRGASLGELADHLAEQAGFGTSGPRSAAPAVKVGPRDPAERWVARHWQAELGDAEPGVHDDFFAAGGNAEGAERMRSAIAGQLGAVPDVDRLFATPTIAAMADLLRAGIEGRGDCPVRPLREGRGEPVFLFHPAGGPTSVYEGLVRLLPGDRAVYGLERIDDENTVEGKAGCYSELIREIQPRGPYRLGGWSFGGCLAYETARRLTAAGERVDLVFMIDSILPLPAPGKPAHEILLDRFDRFAEHVERTYGVPLDFPRAELVQLGEEDQIRLVIGKLAAQVPGMGQGVLRHQYESYVDARVAERYSPEPYAGPVLLLRAQDPHPLTTTLDPRYLRTDDTLGWDAFCADLEVVRIPGDHLSMIDPPHVEVVAAALANRLAAPRAARP
ncbi:type I polyketide synthase [Amycolatopsis regifaucium]|uniref:Polyketide synthase n=1 Tax=Amycolatopsis regifaucium TaxID=546365 RepID=A0A154M5H8_9PSEU|nr:type I polyketide synthase [Amycolatopsis regifaucium]KZB79139.1 polyketide synthase [Amycolatopsis regifaucium]OKA07324.1 polyketide synthase [Amycolatopsis regifaucium]SFH14348.1 phthiocerol/phenolphthiocerol synthesis type-I polyketide synthase D [Amycolatopsis regifaucium]